ncbi:unnamed protein product [Plutella xylostella]|uniref:Hemolin n=1 Tax=Plutella xylostella TaxID=51655 RepID=A0A8S4FY98_PLUXY|nr:unnamed protein product [Plutella xylostella]
MKPNSDLSERYKLLPFEPKIVSSYKAYLDNIGKMAVLPCRVKGHPRPRVVWRDNNGEVVRKKNARMRVFRSGELQISRLAWADMGDFTCTATNHFGTATAKTFVYPVIAPYPCDECSKSFTNKLKLYGHKKTHEKTKTYKCDVCENYFCGPTSLKKHMRLHTGERPYACEDVQYFDRDEKPLQEDALEI